MRTAAVHIPVPAAAGNVETQVTTLSAKFPRSRAVVYRIRSCSPQVACNTKARWLVDWSSRSRARLRAVQPPHLPRKWGGGRATGHPVGHGGASWVCGELLEERRFEGVRSRNNSGNCANVRKVLRAATSPFLIALILAFPAGCPPGANHHLTLRFPKRRVTG